MAEPIGEYPSASASGISHRSPSRMRCGSAQKPGQKRHGGIRVIRPVRSNLLQKDTGGLRLSWFHGEEGDIYIWRDSSGRNVKFLLTFFHRGLHREEQFVEFRDGRFSSGQVCSEETSEKASGHEFSSPLLIYERSYADTHRVRQALAILKKGVSGLLPSDRFWMESMLHKALDARHRD